MRITIRKTSILLSLGMFAALSANAQLPVTDGGNLFMNIKNWVQGFTNGATLLSQLETGLNLYNNAVKMYGVASQEASYIKNRNILLAVGVVAQHAAIPGQPGWDKALTAASGLAASGTAWQQMTTPSASLASRMALADSFGAAALNSIGSCSAAAAQNSGTLSTFESMATDMGSPQNSRASQAGLSNMSAAMNSRVQECQHNLQVQQTKLQLLQVQEQRTRDQYVTDLAAQRTVAMSSLSSADTYHSVTVFTDR